MKIALRIDPLLLKSSTTRSTYCLTAHFLMQCNPQSTWRLRALWPPRRLKLYTVRRGSGGNDALTAYVAAAATALGFSLVVPANAIVRKQTKAAKRSALFFACALSLCSYSDWDSYWWVLVSSLLLLSKPIGIVQRCDWLFVVR